MKPVANVSIRPMTRGDLPKVVLLWNTSFDDEYIQKCKESEFADLSFSHRDFFHQATLVAEEGGRLVGAIGCCRFARMENDGYWYVETPAVINMICVHPDKQRQGVGKRLVEEVERIAQTTGRTKMLVGGLEGMPRFVPGVNSEYESGKKCFESLGYKYVRQTVYMFVSLINYELPAYLAGREKELAAKGYSVCQGTAKDEEAYRQYWLDSEWSELLESMMANFKKDPGSIFVSKCGNRIVGQINRVGVDANKQTTFGAINFLKDYRRHGLGSLMMGKVLKWFRENGGNHSLIWTYEQAAAGFYPKVGYEVVRRWYVYYKPLKFDHTSMEWISRWGH